MNQNCISGFSSKQIKLRVKGRDTDFVLIGGRSSVHAFIS